MRASLDDLLRYPPESAGGLMTTDFVSVPADWTVERTLQHVREFGKNKETVYAVCLSIRKRNGS
jgi:magnesium transporter